MEASLNRHDWLAQWPLMIEANSNPLLISKNQMVILKVPTLYSWLIPLATSPYPYPKVTSLYTLHYIPSYGGKGMWWIIRHSLHCCGSKVTLGIEDKKPNIMTKDAPIILLAQEIPRVSELWTRNHGWRLYTYLYKSQYFSCIFNFMCPLSKCSKR